MSWESQFEEIHVKKCPQTTHKVIILILGVCLLHPLSNQEADVCCKMCLLRLPCEQRLLSWMATWMTLLALQAMQARTLCLKGTLKMGLHEYLSIFILAYINEWPTCLQGIYFLNVLTQTWATLFANKSIWNEHSINQIHLGKTRNEQHHNYRTKIIIIWRLWKIDVSVWELFFTITKFVSLSRKQNQPNLQHLVQYKNEKSPRNITVQINCLPFFHRMQNGWHSN